MSITPAGILAILISFYIIITKKRIDKIVMALFTFNLLYEGFVNVGYFAALSGQIFKVPDYLQIVTAVFAAVIFLRRPSAKWTVFALTIITSVVLLIFLPFDELVRTFNGVDFINNEKYMHYPSFDLQCVKTSLRLLCFTWNFSAVMRIMTKEDWERIREKYFKLGRFVICFAWFEFVFKNLFGGANLMISVFTAFFGADNAVVVNLSRNGFKVIMGFNNEPSQFAMMLFSYLIIYIIGKEWENQTRRQIWITLSAFGVMILCGSFRPVGMIPILILIYMVVSKKSTNSILAVFGLSIGLILLDTFGMVEYYASRLGRAFQFLVSLDPTGIGGGEAGRLYTIVEAFGVFIKRPLFGIGPGQTFAYGFVPSMLAMTGIFGLMAWYWLMFGKEHGISSANSKTKTNLIITFIISLSWIYTDSIAIGYSIYVIAIILEMKRAAFWKTDIPPKEAKMSGRLENA